MMARVTRQRLLLYCCAGTERIRGEVTARQTPLSGLGGQRGACRSPLMSAAANRPDRTAPTRASTGGAARSAQHGMVSYPTGSRRDHRDVAAALDANGQTDRSGCFLFHWSE